MYFRLYAVSVLFSFIDVSEASLLFGLRLCHAEKLCRVSNLVTLDNQFCS